VSILTILEFPDERLRKVAKRVDAIDLMRSTLIDDMFETMYEANGIGLAATQIDFHEQIIVMDVSEDKDAPLCFVNPEIIEQEGADVSEEGCLSVPGFFLKRLGVQKKWLFLRLIVTAKCLSFQLEEC